jgi:hypothetical protein
MGPWFVLLAEEPRLVLLPGAGFKAEVFVTTLVQGDQIYHLKAAKIPP